MVGWFNSCPGVAQWWFGDGPKWPGNGLGWFVGGSVVAEVFLSGGPTIVQRFENEKLKLRKLFTEIKI
jgi:hypothetical protein